jgi:hypothetical protein
MRMNHRCSVEMVRSRSKPSSVRWLRISLEATCLLTRRPPASRWRDLNSGPNVERGNQLVDAKREAVAEILRGKSIKAANWDELIRSSNETFVMNVERRDQVSQLYPSANQNGRS